ncbi:prephenate dehydratase [Rhodobacteraceae bacterium 63075]|nr:prephenate dehydratase [Rhodobacteraceae bacterium 63075]
MTDRIAFQGELGAYSHEACMSARPEAEPVPCASFEDAIEKVHSGDADYAMLPVENTTYGRVADNHRLIPDCGLFIVAEAFVRVRIALMANAGVTLDDVRRVRAHPVLLPQSAEFLKSHGIEPVSAPDSAGAAAELARSGVRDEGVLASELAAKTYGLTVLANDIEDHGHNTTRFVIMGREPDYSRRGELGMMTTFVFEVRNIPAALYKAMGGFATNSVNMTKLESYMVDGSFTATRFYSDIDGHPDDRNVQLALEELGYFTSHLEILGVYPADRMR